MIEYADMSFRVKRSLEQSERRGRERWTSRCLAHGMSGHTIGYGWVHRQASCSPKSCLRARTLLGAPGLTTRNKSGTRNKGASLLGARTLLAAARVLATAESAK